MAKGLLLPRKLLRERVPFALTNTPPAAHAASHVAGDAIQAATATQTGLATAAQITKLDGIETGADVTANHDPKAHTASHTTGSDQLANVVGDSGAGGTHGLVPAPAAGDTAANKFLKASGAWDTPAGVVPAAHASTHVPGGGDAIQDATAAQHGLMSDTYASKLDGIEAGADVTGSHAPQAHAASHISGADIIADVIGDAGAGGTKGMVPAPAAGDAAAAKYLRASGAWATPTTGEIGAQPVDAGLTDIAGLAVTDGNIIVGNGANWVAESGATARTSLGLGSGDSPTFTGATLSGLTNTRVVYAGVGGVLSGSASFLFDGTDLTLPGGGDIKPSADSATAINVANAAGVSFANFDSTNSGFNLTAANGRFLASGDYTGEIVSSTVRKIQARYSSNGSTLATLPTVSVQNTHVSTGINDFSFSSFEMTGSNRAIIGEFFADGSGFFNSATPCLYFRNYTNHPMFFGTNALIRLAIAAGGQIGIGANVATAPFAPTARLHIAAGTASASTAPLKLTSGTLLTAPEAGAVEFLTDKFYGTITTGTARQEFVLTAGLTTGRVTYGTTNGRVIDSANLTFDGTDLTIASTGKTIYRDTAVYVNSGADGYLDLTADTAVRVNSMAYGSMYAHNVTSVLDITVADTTVQMAADLTGGSCNGFTFQNNSELKCLVAGKYKIDWTASVQCGTANVEVEGMIGIGAVDQDATSGHTETVSAGKSMAISGTGIITLAVNDLVRIGFQNHTGTQDITVEHVGVTLFRVGS